jgi:hypothetical protein
MFSLNQAYLYRSSNQWSETAQGFQTLQMINIVTRLQFRMTLNKIIPILRKALSLLVMIKGYTQGCIDQRERVKNLIRTSISLHD